MARPRQSHAQSSQADNKSALGFVWTFSFFFLDMCLETDKSRPHLSLPIINSHSSKKSSYKKSQSATYSFASKSKMDEVPLQCWLSIHHLQHNSSRAPLLSLHSSSSLFSPECSDLVTGWLTPQATRKACIVPAHPMVMPITLPFSEETEFTLGFCISLHLPFHIKMRQTCKRPGYRSMDLSIHLFKFLEYWTLRR